ncbi:hypothetical protein DH2020_002919 [Rehmannia glutinosa]|uniref:Uncharacterized protein n=1 Tax=Rehmannia glutinosa TaxID=99300 RepID=A0ABR0XVJ6_REHGL
MVGGMGCLLLYSEIGYNPASGWKRFIAGWLGITWQPFLELMLNFSGIKSLPISAGHSKLPFQNHNHDTCRFSKCHRSTALFLRKIPNPPFQYFHHQCSRTTSILSAGGNYQLNYEDDSHTEPFWLNQIRGAIRTARSLFFFLIEQPSQLKYIEWPSFQSTLKTATLTLVLVAFLIVALSSVDSALSYLLALLLRRKA